MNLEFKAYDPGLGRWSTDFIGVSAHGSLLFTSNNSYTDKPLAIPAENSRCTVVQFTGFTDSSNTKIFDGDILDYFSIKRIVGWNFETGQWCLKRSIDQNAKYYQQLATVELNKSSVIGNIFENQDIMEAIA